MIHRCVQQTNVPFTGFLNAKFFPALCCVAHKVTLIKLSVLERLEKKGHKQTLSVCLVISYFNVSWGSVSASLNKPLIPFLIWCFL